jgi:hypothetical protein
LTKTWNGLGTSNEAQKNNIPAIFMTRVSLQTITNTGNRWHKDGHMDGCFGDCDKEEKVGDGLKD